MGAPRRARRRAHGHLAIALQHGSPIWPFLGMGRFMAEQVDPLRVEPTCGSLSGIVPGSHRGAHSRACRAHRMQHGSPIWPSFGISHPSSEQV